ncbi:MAG: hypothetical protein WC100_03225 [Sterolibacterium sp.]
MGNDLIILVLDSDVEEIYKISKEAWRINAQAHNAKIFFLNSNRSITNDTLVVEGDTIHTKWINNFHHGLNDKNIKGIRYCVENFDFKYILRTNLSSFFRIDLLNKYLQNTNPTNLYTGSIEHFPIAQQNGVVQYLSFCSGSGFIISSDLAGKVVNNSFNISYDYIDDVWMGLALLDIPRTPFKRVDFCDIDSINKANFVVIQERLKEAEKNGVFHFRVNNKFLQKREVLDGWVLMAILNRTLGW